jgi:hypothetical protein
MRIISPFVDYYDGVQGMGIDKSVVYNRQTEKLTMPIPVKISTSWYDRIKGEVKIYIPSHYYKTGISYHEEESILVFFAGKVYPILKVTIVNFPNTAEFFVRSFDEYIDLITSNGFKNPFEDKKIYRTDDAKKEMENFFTFTKDVSSWMIDNKFAVVMTTGELLRHGHIIKDPCLKNINFQRIIDPYTAYQELSMWVGGILPQSKEIQDIPDKYKIEQHGFNEWSFRKHKLDNK